MKRCMLLLLLALLTLCPRPGQGGCRGHGPDCCGHCPGGGGLVTQAFGVESVVCVTKKGKKYHRAQCRVLKDAEVQKLSRTEAENKGYSPCKICKP